MRKHRYSIRAIARELNRAPSTISRELRRNLRPSGRYVPDIAHSYATARRRRSRRNAHIGPEVWEVVDRYLRMDWSPEQVSGFPKAEGILSISHETIYIHVWADKRAGGDLWTHLRQAKKRCRKRYRSRDWRGRLADKRHISERPAEIEEATGALFYFATPHHSWERGTNENTNELIRQYLPRRTSMAHVTQEDCDAIAAKLNQRPRKRLGYKTPDECYARA